MDAHENARTTPHSRRLIVERLSSGQSVKAVAAALGTTPRTVRKWRDRHAAEGEAGLRDRSSRPHRSPTRLSADRHAMIQALRRQRLCSPVIARQLGLPVSTVGAALRRLGLSRLASLEPRPPILRYEREHPGELIHIDIKKLGRIEGIGHRITGERTRQSNRRSAGKGLGWEFVHVAIDDASRLAYTELLPSERTDSVLAFTRRAIAWFERLGISVERIMTDNGSAYKSFAFRDLLASQSIRHNRTRPYTPRTNGKAERFIQTSLREWAYAQPFQNSDERAKAMHPWLHRYSTQRPLSALKGKAPLDRLRDNLPGNDT
jgi:transposase InsO family protein